MVIGDVSIPLKVRQDWVWGEIARRAPRYKRENFPVDDPHTLYGFLLENFCKFEGWPEAIVMDIGANAGIFTTVCAMNGSRVWAFEPNLPAAAMMEEVLKRNGVRERVTISNNVIWPFTGEVTYGGFATETDGYWCFNGKAGIGGDTVPAISFHDALALQPEWDCVKMDVEGAEFDLLLNVSDEDLRKIKYLTVEFHHNQEEMGKYPRVIEKMEKWFVLNGLRYYQVHCEGDPYYSMQAMRK